MELTGGGLIFAHCNTRQQSTTDCNTLQHITVYYNSTAKTWQHTATHTNLEARLMELSEFIGGGLIFAHCNTLQHTATHCNTHTPGGKIHGVRRVYKWRSDACVQGHLLFDGSQHSAVASSPQIL